MDFRCRANFVDLGAKSETILKQEVSLLECAIILVIRNILLSESFGLVSCAKPEGLTSDSLNERMMHGRADSESPQT